MTTPQAPQARRSTDSGFTKNLKWAATVVSSVAILISAVLVVDQRYAKGEDLVKLRMEIAESATQTRITLDKLDGKLDTVILGLQAVTSERSVRRQEIDRRLDQLERRR